MHVVLSHPDISAVFVRETGAALRDAGWPCRAVTHYIDRPEIWWRRLVAQLGQMLGIETASVAPEHFDWLGPFFAADVPASSTRTRAMLGWEPREPGLIEDIASY